MTVRSGISKEKNAVGVQGGGSSLWNSIAQGRLYEVCVAEWINLILKDVLFRWSKNSSLCGNLPLLLKGNPIKCWGSPYAFKKMLLMVLGCRTWRECLFCLEEDGNFSCCLISSSVCPPHLSQYRPERRRSCQTLNSTIISLRLVLQSIFIFFFSL